MSFKPRAVLTAFLLSFGIVSTPLRADTIELNPDHPQRYTVVNGDTLWDISARFLKDPWRWPNVWNKNQQIKNPHLIYPGDVIVLRYVDGQPELSVLRNEKLAPPAETAAGGETPTQQPEAPADQSPVASNVVKLSPEVRAESLESAIPTVKPDAIAPFLTQPLAVGRKDLNNAGYVTVGLDGRVALGTLSAFYARGLGRNISDRYQIFRPGKKLKHPDTGETLAYEALYLGEARLLESGDPAKLEVTLAKQEIVPGDRLLVAPERTPLPYYFPRAPQKKVYGRVLSALNGVAEFGPGTVVAISLGKREGMEEGQVLRIMRHAGKHRDPVTRKNYKLPDEESGLLMVFRTFDKVSYALVMNANRPIHILDAVKTP